MGAIVRDSPRIVACQERNCPGHAGSYYATRSKTGQIESPAHIGNHECESQKRQYLEPNQLDSDNHRSKNSWSDHKRVWSPRPSVNGSSMASVENWLETSNSSMSEEQQPPAADNGDLEQSKLSPTEPFQSPDDVDGNPTTPNMPAQPMTSRPISNEDSGLTTPNPIQTGAAEGRNRPSLAVFRLPRPTTEQHVRSPILGHSTVSARRIYSASNPERTSKSGGAVGEIVGEARPTSIPAAEFPSKEDDYELISPEGSNTSDDNCNKDLDIRWLCTQDPNEPKYMALIPYSLSSVEPPKVVIRPPKAELQRVAEQRQDVHHRRLEIQNLKFILQAKEKQILNENEETFKRLREFVTERHRRPKIHDSRLELASKLFFESRSSRDECGPLIDEISSLEERLAFEEAKLTQAEDSLYESFDQQENRLRVGLTLLKDDQDLLDTLPEIIQLLDMEIDQSQLEIKQLRVQCLEHGIIDEDDNYIKDGGEVSNDSYSSSRPPPPPPLPPLPGLSVPPKPPVPTLPPPITMTPHPASPLPIADHSVVASNLANLDDESYQNRINPWLLGKLAASRTELTLLDTILSAMDAEPDVASLLDVIKLWDHDGAGIEPPKRLENLDEATLNRLRAMTREIVGGGFDRALVSSLFGLSLWGGEAYGGSAETGYLDDTLAEGS
ncbi:hypothetical protein V496_04396 [Pseudogymnoascus sp. VKM F-4515 (FW-2607)]|nr:hypothetical protein V496_04396 [Pseudogymnoascus sp. VKM F-4515 (FW-2607)]